MYDIVALRQLEFPYSANQIYFNHASISPLPTRAKQKVQQATEQIAENPTWFFQNEGMQTLANVKKEIVGLINASRPDEIVPITSTSAGLNAIAQAIAWQPGDNIIFCAYEFPANAYPWMALAREGVEVRMARPVNGGLELSAIEPLVDGRTRLIAASAIQFFSGHRADLATIGAFCQQAGILFVVDAIQAIGHIPFDVQAMNIDVLATGGQKSLLALPGTGFMYVRYSLCEELQPRTIHGNATKDYLHWLAYDLTPLPGAERFSAGTPNLLGIVSMAASLGLLKELGIANIDHHTRQLSNKAITLLASQGYEVVTPPDHGPIVTFSSGRTIPETDQLVSALGKQKVSVVKHLDPAGTAHLRLSFHCYNTLAEVEQFATILANYG